MLQTRPVSVASLARRHPLVVALAVGTTALVFSLALPVGIDEAIWTTVGRWLGEGRTPYVDAIDNKTPAVFALAWMVELAPAGFAAARAVVVGALACWLTLAASSMAVRAGVLGRGPLLVGGLVGALTAMLGMFLLTTELMTVALMAGAVLAVLDARPRLGVVLALGAVLFDPRAIFLFPGYGLLARKALPRPDAQRITVGLIALVGVGVLAVALHPDLRYGLLELNLGSRQASSWELLPFAVAALASLLPLVVGMLGLRATGMAVLGRGTWAMPGWTMVAGGLLVAALSLQPFHHYWILAVPWIALTVGPLPDPPAQPVRWRLWAAALLLASMPLVVVATAWRQSLSSWHHDYAEAVAIARSATDGLIMQFDQLPFVAWYAPERTPLRSPWLAYLWWQTSRTDDHIEDIASSLPRVSAIIEDGGLEAAEPAVSSSALRVWRLLRSEVGAFGCRLTVGDLFLHLRLDECPEDLRWQA